MTNQPSPMPPPIRQQNPDATPEQIAAALLHRQPDHPVKDQQA